MRVTIIATIRVPGFHFWEGAPPEVRYLASRHRHLFTFRVGVRASHLNRETEYHTLQQQMMELVRRLGGPSGEFGARSCEHLCEELHKVHPDAVFAEVWEDDENGSRIE